ncbi:hypothetical protein Hanom_Chr15g01403901 [Helianthus anomalus]
MLPNLVPGLGTSDHPRLITPTVKGLICIRAGTREPGLLSHSRKDEKAHLVYENGSSSTYKACGNHCGYRT